MSEDNWLVREMRNARRRVHERKTEEERLSFYGGDKTFHRTGWLDIETRNGEVVAVWFRCAMLPFRQTEVDKHRAKDMKSVGAMNENIRGIEFEPEFDDENNA
jgi:hypothetical protein